MSNSTSSIKGKSFATRPKKQVCRVACALHFNTIHSAYYDADQMCGGEVACAETMDLAWSLLHEAMSSDVKCDRLSTIELVLMRIAENPARIVLEVASAYGNERIFDPVTLTENDWLEFKYDFQRLDS